MKWTKGRGDLLDGSVEQKKRWWKNLPIGDSKEVGGHRSDQRDLLASPSSIQHCSGAYGARHTKDGRLYLVNNDPNNKVGIIIFSLQSSVVVVVPWQWVPDQLV